MPCSVCLETAISGETSRGSEKTVTAKKLERGGRGTPTKGCKGVPRGQEGKKKGAIFSAGQKQKEGDRHPEESK